MKCISHDEGYLCGKDTTLYELSQEYANKVLRHVERHPDIYYISLATQCTHDSYNRDGTLSTVPDASMSFLLRLMSNYIGNRDNTLPPDQRHNDGLVPVDSQRAPPGHEWIELKGVSYSPIGMQKSGDRDRGVPSQQSQGVEQEFPKGIWLVCPGHGDHLYYMFCPRRLQFYTSFYDELYSFLKRLPQ